jgi:hypothetical protein
MSMIFKNIRKRSRLYLILFSLILLVPNQANVSACGFIPEKEELRYMLFNPDITENKSWWTFFYNGKLNYLDGAVSSVDDENILTAEWIQAMKVSMDTSIAFDCLFGSLSDSALQHNAFYKEIQKRPAFKQYFAIARRSEEVSNITIIWDEEDKKEKAKKDVVFSQLVEDVMQLLEKESDPFFKKKYAFQLAKLAFYSTDAVLFEQVYTQYFKNTSDRNVLDWWAMHYKSMRLESLGKMDSANYLHALVFSHSSNKMFAAKQYFSKHNFDTVLMLAQTEAEKAELYLLREVINPGRSLEGIQQVYTRAPLHKHLPLLISREINKLEDWLGSTKYAEVHPVTGNFWDESPSTQNWQRDHQYLVQFIAALEKMTSLQQAHPVYFKYALANLYLLKGDAVKSAFYLSKIKLTNRQQEFQVNIFKVVLTTLKENIRDAAVQDKIGKLYQQLLDTRDHVFESQKMLYSLSAYLRYSFAKNGMVYLAGLFDNYALNKFCYTCHDYTFEYSMISYLDRHASTQDLDALLAIYDRPQKNKLEEVLLKPYTNKYCFLDVLSAKHLRKGDVKNARLALQNIPDSFWYNHSNASYYLDHDPFSGNYLLLAGETMDTYNKREIVEKMHQLEQDVVKDSPDKNHSYMQLANAWYNFTSKSWLMISYGRGTSTPDENVYKIAYIKALDYYKKALELEPDKETRAKILYMIIELSESQNRKEYAIQYEKLKDTDFYTRRNCFTIQDIATGAI